MTAADLIQFLRQHPETCRVLGIVEMNDEVTAGGAPILHAAVFVSAEDQRVEFVHEHRQCTAIVAKLRLDAISGAATAKADEMGIETEQEGDGSYRWYYGQCFCPTDTSATDDDIAHGGVNFPTRLHATFAAIEAAITEETT